ncbi:TRAP transporter substrate-binding protein [Georgenia muralis]|uniref:Tripartite ATP-independent transporter DctP family solute receptor n=1 Tax=Georgenia muralis TaxID=154117 RepID=A0A3N4Z0Y7_9MICO|nr:TRAP transporter substrate-binding protein [Georgenia muralis]RPF26267.1 tripartite ATP-independent transporter DctP family solute receptor [Georgenia muralis]
MRTSLPTTRRVRAGAAAAGLSLTLVLAACGGASDETEGDDAAAPANDGETFTLIAGHQLAADTPFDEGLDEFARLVEEKTEGQVTVEVHPNAELGTETDMFQAMQNGTMDVAIVAPGSIAEFVPQVSILSMPFLVTSREQRDEIIEGPIAEELAATIEETSGIVPMSYFGGGVRQMFFTEPAESLDDIQGRLFRVQPSEVLTNAFGAVGLEPTVVAYNELYNALQTGVVEGAENESVYIDSQKFYEPAPNILLTNHEVTIRPLIIGSQTLERLPEDLREAVLEAGEEAGAFERELEAQVDDEKLAALGEMEGVTITEVDTAGVEEQVRPVWEQYAAEWGAEDMLEQILELRQ